MKPCWPVIAPAFNGTRIASYPFNQSTPGHITEVSDPAGSGQTVLRFETLNTDLVAPPSPDPRSQLFSAKLFTAGSEWWSRGAFYLPPGFPIEGAAWLQLVQLFGSPFEGVAPWALKVDRSPGQLMYQRRSDYGFDIPWEGPSAASLIGKWTEYLTRTKFAVAGELEQWINGVQTTFFNPASSYNPNHEPETTRLAMKTLDPGVNDGEANAIILQNYHAVGFPEAPVTVYHKPLLIGRTRGSVGG